MTYGEKLILFFILWTAISLFVVVPLVAWFVDRTD